MHDNPVHEVTDYSLSTSPHPQAQFIVALVVVEWTIIFIGSFCMVVLSVAKPPQAGEDQKGKFECFTDRTIGNIKAT